MKIGHEIETGFRVCGRVDFVPSDVQMQIPNRSFDSGQVFRGLVNLPKNIAHLRQCQ